MDEGAFGLSTGLSYPPGMFADTAEIEKYFTGDIEREEYGRYGNPTVRAAEQKLSALEGSDDAALFARLHLPLPRRMVCGIERLDVDPEPAIFMRVQVVRGAFRRRARRRRCDHHVVHRLASL